MASSNIWWTKLYFQSFEVQPDKGNWNNSIAGYSRFDFYNHYYNFDQQWEPVCSIIFDPHDFWVIDHASNHCQRRRGVGNLSRFWLKNATFQRKLNFRGVWADEWRLDGSVPEDTIFYYASAQSGLPLRSTNQAEDPGATDYFDVSVGAQNRTLFQLPISCQHPVQKVSCPPEGAPMLFQRTFQ